MKKPHVIIIAGPNGAGKSTTAPAVLQGVLGVTEFVNADTIAAGLSAFNPEKAAFHAGRVMLERLQQLAANGENFAFETTLASKTFAHWLKTLKVKGYAFHLIYLWLPSPEFAVARVAERVRMGGHNVPEETIRRRYHAGLKNFFNQYQPLADTWRMYDNSAPGDPCLLSYGEHSKVVSVMYASIWEAITRGHNG
ncbi:MAG: zeta toxin family protein [Deltaproteobacteria bacterium]|nr:zeta toxin family protein [Deltaproteobacteria bacterium]